MQTKNNSLQTVLQKQTFDPTGPQTWQMLSLARRNGWSFQVLGYAALPKEQIRLKNWLVVPASQDNTQVPTRTLERIRGIYTTGLRPKGFVVVHEAPMTLTAPPKQPIHLRLPAPAILQVEKPASTSSALIGLASVLSAFGTMIFPMLFFGLLALDPIVVAVMEDDCWIEIDRWDIPVKS